MKTFMRQLLSFFALTVMLASSSMATTQTISSNILASNWGLDRIDQRLLPLSGNYTYNNTGAGVNVYVFDNGINLTHQEFGGRASHVYDATLDGGILTGCDDHGTHVAGIIGGATYGVAKQANLLSVKVASCTASSQPEIRDDSMIRALDWIRLNHVKPAVVNLSLARYLKNSFGTPYMTPNILAIEARIEALIAEGVPVVAGAGNIADDVTYFTPARVPSVITVGGTQMNDQRLWYSGYGSGVDIYAPGDYILSATNSSSSATTLKSGTSMSTAFVTGVVAKYLQSNPAATPAQVNQYLYNTATWAIIPDPYDGTPDHLLYNSL